MGYRYTRQDQIRRLLFNERCALIKLQKGCVDCGYNKNASALEFDHRDRETKLFNISNAANRKWETVLLEINKCDVRCANCHRIRTIDQLGWDRSFSDTGDKRYTQLDLF